MENYSKFSEGMILRDYLALDRTIIANERTLLAYARTFVGLLSAGVGMVGILDMLWTTVLGYIFVVIAPVVMIFGLVRYRRVQKRLAPLSSVVKGKDNPAAER